jgi:hypothetical protein
LVYTFEFLPFFFVFLWCFQIKLLVYDRQKYKRLFTIDTTFNFEKLRKYLAQLWLRLHKIRYKSCPLIYVQYWVGAGDVTACYFLAWNRSQSRIKWCGSTTLINTCSWNALLTILFFLSNHYIKWILKSKTVSEKKNVFESLCITGLWSLFQYTIW